MIPVRRLQFSTMTAIGLMLTMHGASAQSAASSSNPPIPAAASSGGEAPAIEEIVVTAEKHSENLQQAPAAITVVSGEVLAARGFQDIRDATVPFPSVEFSPLGSITHLYIRGIGAEQDRANIDPLVVMSQDGVNLPREITGNNLFDIASIESLPGPQSTLYGNSSAGGAVSITNNRPVNSFMSSAAVEGGNYGFVHATAVENIPVSDALAVRGAFDYARHDGYYAEGSDAEDEFGGRVSALYKPTDDVSAYLWGSYNHTAGAPAAAVGFTANGVPANPRNPWSNNSCAPTGAGFPLGANPACDPLYGGAPTQPSDTQIVSGELQWRLDGVTLFMTPSYLYDQQSILQYFGPFPNAQHIWDHQWSDELKAVSDSGGPLKWLAGLYWYKDSQYQFFNLNGSAGNPAVRNNETTYAAYGQATYAIQDWLRVTGGLRYSSNEKDGYGCNCTAGDNEGIYFTSRHTTPSVDWKVGLDADIAPRSMAYATVQTGYDNGTYNYYNTSGLLGPQNAGPSPLVPATRLLAYTVGIKNRFFGGTLQVNDEAYYYDYKNLLVAPFDSNPAHFGNAFYAAEKTAIYGDELDVLFFATPADQLSANLGLLHAAAVNFVVGDPAVNYDGYQLVDSPTVTLNVGYQHTFDLSDGANVAFSANTHYESGYWTTFNHYAASHQGAFTNTDITLTYTSADGRWSASLWTKNVEDSAVIGIGGQVGAGALQSIGVLRPPRTFGVRLTAKYE